MHKYQKSKSRQKFEQDKLSPASESPFRKERTEKEIARVVMPRRWKVLPATGAVAYSSTASFIETTKPGQFRAESSAKAKSLPTFCGNNRLSAACGYIGFKKEWTRKLGVSCSAVKSGAY